MAIRKEKFTGKLIVPDFSDTQLRDVILFTADPMSLGKVADCPPSWDEDLEFIAQYEASEQLVCAFGHWHSRGFALRGLDGRVYLIGRDCALLHYGLEWNTFVADVDRKLSRQEDLRWLHKVSRAILDSEERLREIVKSPEVEAFDELRKQVRRLPEAVFRAFSEAAAGRDTWMRASFPERDLAAERKATERAYEAWQHSVSKGQPKHIQDRLKAAWRRSEKDIILTDVTKAILRCPAKTVFLRETRMAPRLARLVEDICAQARNLDTPQMIAHRSTIARSMTDAASLFDEILSELHEADRLFAPATLDALETLFSGVEYRGVEAKRTAVGMWFEDRSGEAELKRPEALRPIDFSLLKRVREDTLTP